MNETERAILRDRFRKPIEIAYFVGLLVLIWFGINHLTDVRFDYHSTDRDVLFAVIELAIPWGLMLIFAYQHRIETWDKHD